MVVAYGHDEILVDVDGSVLTVGAELPYNTTCYLLTPKALSTCLPSSDTDRVVAALSYTGRGTGSACLATETTARTPPALTRSRTTPDRVQGLDCFLRFFLGC
jgi:hypothetical protein